MPTGTQTQDKTVKVIVDKGVLETVLDGITALDDEAVIVFDPDDGFECILADPASVALSAQYIKPSDFQSYEVDGEFAIGINAVELSEVVGQVNDVPVKLEYDFDDFMLKLRAGDVRYNFTGLEPDTVTGSPTHIPPIDDDDKEYTVRAVIPTDGFKRAAKLIDMKASVARFVMSPDGFLFEADGDTDDISIDAADTDAFEWIDQPDETAVSRQSVNYMKEIMREFDEDTVEVVAGDDHPYHVLTKRGPADRRVVDTHFVTAPRLDTT